MRGWPLTEPTVVAGGKQGGPRVISDMAKALVWLWQGRRSSGLRVVAGQRGPTCVFPTCFLSEAYFQLPPSQMACSLGLCSWAGPGLGSQGCRENLPQGGGQWKACCPSGNLIPGPETFSICQIGFPFWFQSEDKPGPAVSGPPRCPPPLSGCLCLPPRHQSPPSHLCSLFSSLCWWYLLKHTAEG